MSHTHRYKCALCKHRFRCSGKSIRDFLRKTWCLESAAMYVYVGCSLGLSHVMVIMMMAFHTLKLDGVWWSADMRYVTYAHSEDEWNTHFVENLRLIFFVWIILLWTCISVQYNTQVVSKYRRRVIWIFQAYYGISGLKFTKQLIVGFVNCL